MAPVWCPKNFFWSIWKGELYQLWTPNCSNPEVAHHKWINTEITSFCNTFCPILWLLKSPSLRDLPIHFFDLKKIVFNYKLFLLTSSSGYKKKNWLLRIVFLYLTVKETKDRIPIRPDLRPSKKKKLFF